VFAMQQANLAGKVIVVVLFVGSIFAWSVMISKIGELRVARRASRRFLSAYRSEAHPLTLYLGSRKYEGSPLYSIYKSACMAVGSAFELQGVGEEDLFKEGIDVEDRNLSELHLSAVRTVAERVLSDQALLLENSMGFLATATSTAPFLGLLGTVWGVMESFGGMVAGGTAMLSAVAPGISGALLTTVVGLLVALPSLIGYNLLTDRIRRMSVEMDNFTQELISSIERQYLPQ